MELIVLGNNGPYPAPYGATAGYLVRTDEGFVALDMGSGVFARIGKLCNPENISAVVLSHLHYDHISDMGVFNYYLEQLHKKKKFSGRITCYVPPVASEIAKLEAAYPYFRFVGVKAEGSFRFAGMKAEFSKLNHGAVNYGVRLTEEKSGRKLVYSGDTNVCPNLEKLLSKCDLWLGGAPFIGKEYKKDGGHLSVEVMENLAVRFGVKAVLTHLWPMHTEREYQSALLEKCVEIATPFKSYHV
ncbi:MAG: MBL fold metallo-hydrolase [Clostridia bacterium]|nr:MBL fold metallo-hydrolase [Clostridia bacterium]